MALDMNRYLAYIQHSYGEICKTNQYSLIPWSYHWTRMLHDNQFPCRCGKPGHQFPQCPDIKENIHRFVDQVLTSLKSKWTRQAHNQFSTCFNCHLFVSDKVAIKSSHSTVEHTNITNDVTGICIQTPPHIIGPVVAMFRMDLFRDLVGYPHAKVSVDAVTDFLLQPMPLVSATAINVSRLHFLLASDIFACNGANTFPTHRYDKRFTENIIKGTPLMPSAIEYPAQTKLMQNIDRTLASARAGPESAYDLSQGPIGHNLDHYESPPPRNRSFGSQMMPPPPSQDPSFTFSARAAAEEDDDPFLYPSRPTTPNGRGGSPPFSLPPSQNPSFLPPSQNPPSLPPSQNPSFSFGTPMAVSPLSTYKPTTSYRPLPYHTDLSRSTPGPSRSKPSHQVDLSRSTPGPSRSRDVDLTNSSQSSRGDARAASSPHPTRGPSASPNTSNRIGLDGRLQSRRPAALTPGTHRAGSFVPPGLPASQTPSTPTPGSRTKMPATAMSSRSPLADTPIIPPSALRFNPYPKPLLYLSSPSPQQPPTQ